MLNSGCTQAIIFLTDGEGPDPRAVINKHNGGPYSGARADKEQHYTRIFTYAFGDNNAGAGECRVMTLCVRVCVCLRHTTSQAIKRARVPVPWNSYSASG